MQKIVKVSVFFCGITCVFVLAYLQYQSNFSVGSKEFETTFVNKVLSRASHLANQQTNPECPSNVVIKPEKKSELETAIQQHSSFKRRGVSFNCITRQTIKTYDADALDRIAKPLNLTARPGGESAEARKSSFTEIFDKQVWGGKEPGQQNKMSENYKASGPGSSLINTQGAAALLHSVIEQLKVDLNKDVISIADIPCGDLQWISHFLKTRTDIDYTGIDIVPTLIQRHKITYHNFPNIHFINSDVVESPLSQSYDIIFSRQMMQHFKDSDIQRVLYHFSTSGSRYMIATTYSQVTANRELASTEGFRYRLVNLELKPYSLVPPTCTYQETQQTDNYLGMWELPLRVKQ